MWLTAQRFCVICVLLLTMIAGSRGSAFIETNPEAKLIEYFDELDYFFVTHHLVEKNEKRLKKLVFQFKEIPLNAISADPYINVVAIDDVFIVKIIDLPLINNQFLLNEGVEKVLIKAYLFSEALIYENKDENLWGNTKVQLDVPDVIITGLLALKKINHLETKVAASNYYRSQQKVTNMQDLKLDFQTTYSLENKPFTLASLSFVGTWKSWLAKSGKYPNWNEIIKFRGDWKTYFKNQLPDPQKWMETESQWLEFRLLNLLKRQPYDKLTLDESKESLEKLWLYSAPLWESIGKPMTKNELKIINYLKKEISSLYHIINPYYHPLIVDLQNLLEQKWMKSPSDIKSDQTKKNQLAQLNLSEEQLQRLEDQPELEPNLTKEELTNQLRQLYLEFKQKLAQRNLKAQLMIEFTSQESEKSNFVDSDEKKASNQSSNLYKRDPVAYYLNQYN